MRYVIFYIFSIFLVMYLCVIFPSRRVKTKVNTLRNEISQERNILFDGMFRNGRNYGFLFLTDRTLEFYYEKTSKKYKNFYIPIENVCSVSVVGNLILGKKLEIKTIDDDVSVMMKKPEFCCKLITETIEKSKNEFDNIVN